MGSGLRHDELGTGGERVTSRHDRVVRYLAATGWIAPEEDGSVGGLWRHPVSKYLLPVPKEIADAGFDWQVVTQRVAMVEGTDADSVAARMESEAVDIASIRAAKELVIRDSIPYNAGVALVQSSWTMLRSSATTALGQRATINRYSKIGDDLIAAARMAHTRKGSYIVPIMLPITVSHQDSEDRPELAIPGMELNSMPEPPERRVMRTFAEALTTLDRAVVQPEQEPRADIDAELVRAGVSHQFARALHNVLAHESVEEFSATFEWSPLGGPAPKGVDNIAVPSTASERIGNVARRLKSKTAARIEEQFVGPIRGVERDHEADTGSVRVQGARNGRPVNVTVNVSEAILDTAWQWARDRRTVVVAGRVRRSRDGLIAEAIDAVTPLMLDIKQ